MSDVRIVVDKDYGFSLKDIEPGDWFKFKNGARIYIMLEGRKSYVCVETGKAYQSKTCCRGQDAEVRYFPVVWVDTSEEDD